jgi:threonine/homoserine/homoserine lactone efflux protein
MYELVAVATITVLAVISPGADFAMVTRNSLLYGRHAGLLASVGIALGVQLHVLYTMLGVGLLLRGSPVAFHFVRLAGAFYLIYVGYKTFVDVPGASDGGSSREGSLSSMQALRTGFLTNALNPKTTLFVVSVYAQVVSPATPVPMQIAYGAFMSLAHWLWFSIVTFFFSEQHLRARMLSRQVLLNRLIGAVLGALGIWLALAPSAS